ncbi:hypothetical protein C2W59_01309 [Bacillus pumilus]|nr:hypothetical protein C2W59_01309 [Bacillus pumilus]
MRSNDCKGCIKYGIEILKAPPIINPLINNMYTLDKPKVTIPTIIMIHIDKF